MNVIQSGVIKSERVRKPAAFLDRDGVINVDKGYTWKKEDLVFTPTILPAIRVLKQAGYYVLVVTNQSGVARGMYTEQNVVDFDAHMQQQLDLNGAGVDAIYYCPFHPQGSVPAYTRSHPDRKPAPGMLERAFREWPIDRAGSFLVGDNETDIMAARAVNIPGILVEKNVCDVLSVVKQFLNQD